MGKEIRLFTQKEMDDNFFYFFFSPNVSFGKKFSSSFLPFFLASDGPKRLDLSAVVTGWMSV